MSMCEHTSKCAFYNNRMEMPGDGSFFKELFCRKGAQKCARNRKADVEDVSDPGNTRHPLGMKISELFEN